MTHSLRLFDNFLSNISKTSSIISLTIWLFTQIPQIILNHKRRDVSLSISFVGLTFLADIINLTYQISIKDSPYSILLVYMIILDLIIISQYFYYSRYFKKPVSPPPPPQQQQQQPTLVDRILGAAFVTDLVSAMNIKAQQPEYHHQKQTSPVHFDWVQILPIVCCFLYIISRIPQIRRNYIRKSTTGLSLYMVLFTVLGTIFNLLSIVTDTNLYNVLSIKIFLIGSLVIVLMDGALLYQFWLYRKHISAHENDTVDIDEQSQWYVKNQPLVFYQSFEQHKHKQQELAFSASVPSITSSLHFSNSIHPIKSNQSRGRKLVKSPGEQTSLLDESLIPSSTAIAVSMATPPPPQHYIVSSSARYQSFHRFNSHQNPQSKIIPQSLTSSSVGSATSLIPSIIGNISSVNKKLMDGSKIPFSPIDFLTDDYYNSNNNKNKNSHSHSHSSREGTNGSVVIGSTNMYYGSIDT
ncbi:hypothetical protein MGE_03720 [Candida albicans P75010]|nr:hypothetical protein MGE_03720 [Candida albicans P75010]